MTVAPAHRVWRPVELVRWSADYLAGKGFEDARLNAELLLAGALGVKRLDLYLQFERPLTPAELADYKSRLKRRLRGEPLQYIAGTAEFRHLTLKVDRRVLIPRPETEVLVDLLLDWSRDRSGLDVVDVGTGSGAIALSLRQEGEFGRVVATDVSEPALELAMSNRDRVMPGAEVEFRRGSLFEPITGERFDIVVSNPPYVAENDRATLPDEVAKWEPESALFAGGDGLDVIRALIAGASSSLRPGGLLALEVGADQAATVAQRVESNPTFTRPSIARDLTGRERFVLAEATRADNPNG